MSAEDYAREALRTVFSRRVVCELLGGVSGVCHAIGKMSLNVAHAIGHQGSSTIV